MSTSNDCNVTARIKKSFEFLEKEFGFTFSGLRVINNGSLRDSGVVAKYRSNQIRIDIGWSPAEFSLSILLRLEDARLTRKERYIYFEPFIEFISNGVMHPIIPQIYHGMSVAKIDEAIEKRKDLFAKGSADAVDLLAKRLHDHFTEIQSTAIDVIRKYHEWYESRGKA